jgi:creatinine amidohydrolase
MGGRARASVYRCRVPSNGFAELTTFEAAALLGGDRIPVLLLPVAAIEPHGPHAPLQTDELIATAICERAATAAAADDRVRVLVLPALSYGVTRYAAAFTGAISIAPATLIAIVVDVVGSLVRDGFSRVVIVNHHFEPEHLEGLHDATATLNEQGARVALLDLTRRRSAERLTDEFRRGSCHAGSYETSLLLAQTPALVDRAAMLAAEPLEVPMPAEIAAGHTDFIAMGMHDAYCGEPAQASAAEGERTYEALVQLVLELVDQVIADP